MMNSLLGTRYTKSGYGNYMENMRLTHIDALQTFYLQTPKQVHELAKLQKQLDKLEDTALTPVDVGINMVYGINFKKKWYRIRIISSDKSIKKKEVVDTTKGFKYTEDLTAPKPWEGCLIDKGQRISVKRTELVTLPTSLARALPATQPFSLDNVKFPKELSKPHENKINNWLHLNLNNKPITVIPQYPQGSHHKTFVKMYVDNVCINEKLIDLGFAQRLFNPNVQHPRMSMELDLAYPYQHNDYSRPAYNKGVSNGSYGRNMYDYNQSYRDSQMMNGSKFYGNTNNANPVYRDYMYQSSYNDYNYDRTSGFEEANSIYGEHCRSREFPHSNFRKGLLGNAPGYDCRDDLSMQSTVIEGMRREIQAMRGQIRAYEHQIKESQEENFVAKAFGVSKLGKSVISKRNSVMPKIDTESPLTKVLTMLLEKASFHTSIDAVITSGKEIRSLIETKNMESTDPKIVEMCKEFETNFESLKFNDTQASLQTAKADITLAVLEIEKARSFTPSMKPSQAQLGVAFVSIAHQYKSWRNSYISSHKNTSISLEEVASLFESCSLHFKELSKANAKTQLELSKEKAINAFKACSRESSLSKKEHLIYLMLVSCRKEINNRIRKLDHLSTIYHAVKKLGVLKIEGLDPKDSTDEPPLSLLKFINRSGQSVQSKSVYLFLQDILKELIELHSEGKKYIFLNPENVMIKEGASLVPLDKAKRGEPIFPFAFIAPEVKKKVDKVLKTEEENRKLNDTSTVTSSKCYLEKDVQEDKELGTAADIYSFGQLILWLACLDLGGMSFEIWDLMQDKMRVISDLLSTDPIHRPSAVHIKETLPEIFVKMFGESIEEETLALEDLKVDLKDFVDANSDIEIDSGDEDSQDGNILEDGDGKINCKEEDQVIKELNDSENNSSEC